MRESISSFVIPAKAGIAHTLVILAKAGIQCVFALRRFAKADSRPCAAWSPSMATRYFLLLVQEKVTKENTPSAPRPRLKARVRYGRTGSTDRPSMACSRIGAIPRAARVRGTRLIRPPFPAALEGLEERGRGKVNLLALTLPSPASGRGEKPSASAVGTAALCPSRAPLGRGEQAEEIVATAGSRRVCRSTKDVLSANPAACSHSRRAWMPGDRGREGVFSLVSFFWTSKRKSLGRQDGGRKNTRT